MSSTSQTHRFRRIMPLIFMVIMLWTLVTSRPHVKDSAPKMGLMLMHRLITVCQAQ
jgi:peptidoglycan/LPS O-acetylase OafA/YrhL